MVFEQLRVTPKTRITSAWGNALVDAIELIYSLGKRGDPDTPFKELYGVYGFFSEDLFVKGKRVVKDGDPVSISDIFPYAQQKITEAIDRSLATLYMRDTRDRLASLRIDVYGNVGVVIAEPLDQYGNIRIANPPGVDIPLSVLRDEFRNVEASLLNANETAAQSIVLDARGRTVISILAWSTAPTNFYVDVSFDGVTWRQIASYTNTASVFNTFVAGMRFWRLRSDPAGAAGDRVSLVIQAGR